MHECDEAGDIFSSTRYVEATTLDTIESPATPEHAHHWRIEEPNGQSSHAICKKCGAEREFRNWLAETDFITRSEIGLAA